MVRVLIVDDSSFVRTTLKAMLEQDPEIKVVGFAVNGQEAIEKNKELDPDIITLDIEMPRMDGLQALQRIMKELPCPIIMVSSLTREGADSTLKALEYGALDYFAKPSSSTMDPHVVREDLVRRIKELSRRKATMRLLHKRSQRLAETALASQGRAVPPVVSPPVVRSASAGRAAALNRPRDPNRFDAVCIGVSTGGPPAVQKILSQLPEKFPVPILIAQHMPVAFTGPFAARLNSQCAITVVEVDASVALQPATAYVCRGGMHMQVQVRQGLAYGVVSDEPKSALYKPSANILFESAAGVFGRRTLCIVLTGMGNDGLEGAKPIKEKGGYILAQSEETCVVYGMPKAIVDAKLADEIVGIDDMASVLRSLFNL